MNTKRKASPTIYWVGIDISKADFHMAFWGHLDFSEMEVLVFKRQRKVMKQVLAKLAETAPKGMQLGIVMEATGKFSEEVATWLRKLDPKLRICIVNPAQTSAFIKSLGFRNKTDGLDAKALARYGEDRNPVGWEPLSPELAVLRDLTRTRGDLVGARTAMKNRLNDHKRASKTATKALETIIRSLEGQVEALEVAITEHVKAHPELAHQVRLFGSIKGVGIVTSTVVLAEIGDLHRFSRSRKLSAFAGLSPKLKDSGSSVHGKPRMCKQGSARIRVALYMAASNAIQYNPDMKAFYDHLRSKGKEPRAALGAIMRKLLVLMRAVLIADQDWKPRLAA
jgi:transposase